MHGDNKLTAAVRAGDEQLVREMVANGVDVNKGGAMTPLVCASQLGHIGLVTFLLENGAKVDYTPFSSRTALMGATTHDHTAVVDLLLRNGAVVNKAMKSGLTALLIACSMGCLDATINVLLDHGADINLTNSKQMNALMCASHSSRTSVVRLLLARDDVDTAARNNNGADCLDLATTDEIKQLIIDHRSSKEQQRLVDIGLGFASKQLPVHLLVNIYEQCIVFEDQAVSLFKCWEILKVLKK